MSIYSLKYYPYCKNSNEILKSDYNKYFVVLNNKFPKLNSLQNNLLNKNNFIGYFLKTELLEYISDDIKNNIPYYENKDTRDFSFYICIMNKYNKNNSLEYTKIYKLNCYKKIIKIKNIEIINL